MSPGPSRNVRACGRVKQSGGGMVDATRYGNTEGDGESPISGK